MKALILTALALMSLAQQANAAEAVRMYEDRVSLRGQFKTVQHDPTDLEFIEKCGESHSVFVLDQPLTLKYENPNDGEFSLEVIREIRLWGTVTVKEDGRVVEGRIGEELMGLCAPGLTILGDDLY